MNKLMQDRWKRLAAYAVKRAQEPSTWRGLILVAGACGAVITEKHAVAFITAATMLAGCIGVFFADPKPEDDQ